MLNLISGRRSRDCEGTTRRDFIKVGALGLGSVALPELLRLSAQCRADGQNVKEKAAVISLWGTGGTADIETFDPKMIATAEYRCTTDEPAAPVPSVTVGNNLRKNARTSKPVITEVFTPLGENADDCQRPISTAGLDCGNNPQPISPPTELQSGPLNGPITPDRDGSDFRVPHWPPNSAEPTRRAPLGDDEPAKDEDGSKWLGELEIVVDCTRKFWNGHVRVGFGEWLSNLNDVQLVKLVSVMNAENRLTDEELATKLEQLGFFAEICREK